MRVTKLLTVLLLTPLPLIGSPGFAESRDHICDGYILSNNDVDQSRWGEDKAFHLIRDDELVLDCVYKVECKGDYLIGLSFPDFNGTRDSFFILEKGTGRITRIQGAENFNRSLDSLGLLDIVDKAVLVEEKDYFAQSDGPTLIKAVLLILSMLITVVVVRKVIRNRRRLTS